MLNHNYNYPVLGIECSQERIKQANANQSKYHPNSKDQVVFVEYYIEEHSSTFITNTVKDLFQEQDIKSSCIVGLHACADLSIIILKLFMEMEFCKGLIIMPCCYHRLKIQEQDENRDIFENFPISAVFKKVFSDFTAEEFLRVPFLRLACQQNIGSFISMSEEEHRQHARSFLYRAILEAVTTNGKLF